MGTNLQPSHERKGTEGFATQLRWVTPHSLAARQRIIASARTTISPGSPAPRLMEQRRHDVTSKAAFTDYTVGYTGVVAVEQLKGIRANTGLERGPMTSRPHLRRTRERYSESAALSRLYEYPGRLTYTRAARPEELDMCHPLGIWDRSPYGTAPGHGMAPGHCPRNRKTHFVRELEICLHCTVQHDDWERRSPCLIARRHRSALSQPRRRYWSVLSHARAVLATRIDCSQEGCCGIARHVKAVHGFRAYAFGNMADGTVAYQRQRCSIASCGRAA